MTLEDKFAIYRRAEDAQGEYFKRYGCKSDTQGAVDALREMRRIMPGMGTNPKRIPAERMNALLAAVQKLESLLRT